MYISKPPLVFVSLGPLPTWAALALMYASETHGDREIWLITDGLTGLTVDTRIRIHYVDLNSSLIDPISRRYPGLSSFRDAFWVKTIGRFFALRDWATHCGMTEFWHAELDSIVFDLSMVEQPLMRFNGDLFVPSDCPGRCIGSLIFVRNYSCVLDELCEFILHKLASKFSSDMELLYDFCVTRETAKFLPSAPPISSSYTTASCISLGNQIFDAAAFGQYLFGVDPRNIRLLSFNGFRNEKIDYDISMVRFQVENPGITVHVQGQSFNMVNIHNHAKSFGQSPRDLLAKVVCHDGRLNRRLSALWVFGQLFYF